MSHVVTDAGSAPYATPGNYSNVQVPQHCVLAASSQWIWQGTARLTPLKQPSRFLSKGARSNIWTSFEQDCLQNAFAAMMSGRHCITGRV